MAPTWIAKPDVSPAYPTTNFTNTLCQSRTQRLLLGLLVTVDEHFNMHIVNTFSNLRVPLPPVSAILKDDRMDIDSNFVMFAALSSSNPQNTIVMVAAGEFGRLAFARLGDDSWTLIVDEHFLYDDVIFYKGAFYAISSEYETFVCDIQDPHPKTKLIAPNLCEMVVHKRCLVESARELLLVHRYNDWENDNTIKAFHYTTFDVYKLDMSMHKWNQVKSLDDRALFLDFNTSVLVSRLNYEDCSRDCIYFTDDYQDAYPLRLMAGHDMGIFYLKDRSIKQLNEDARLIQPMPIG